MWRKIKKSRESDYISCGLEGNWCKYYCLCSNERFELFIDGEADDKCNKLIYGIQRKSKIRIPEASVSDIRFYPDREIDKMLTLKHAECDYIDEEHLDVIIVGVMGACKTYYISALGNAAWRKRKMLNMLDYRICFMNWIRLEIRNLTKILC